MSALVLVNPTAGGGRAGEAWRRWRPEAERLGPIVVEAPADAAGSRVAIERAVAAGCTRVVAFGGDGTAHLAARCLLERGFDHVTLGVVPAGTGSDLARALGTPRDMRAALERALLGPPRQIDAGRCCSPSQQFSFVNIASLGISGMVDEAVNALPNRGRTAFLRATLAALVRYRSVPVEVEVDGAPWYDGPVLVLAVANGTSFGKGMHIAPRARLDDGLLDVVLVGGVEGLARLRKLPLVYLGRHLGVAGVRFERARRVIVRPRAPLPVFDVDGETYPSGPATFSVLPGALRVAGPVE